LTAIRGFSRLASVGTGPLVATALANGVIAACGLVSGTLLARMLGADGRGELAAVQGWPLLLAAVGSVGLTEAAAYFAAKAPERARTTLASATTLSLPFSVAAAAMGLWILPYALQSQAPDVLRAARISLLLVPLMALVSAPQQALRGAGQYTAWNLLRILVPLGWVAALLVVRDLAMVSVTAVAIAFVVVTASVACIGYLCAWRILAGSPAPAASLTRPMLSYGVPTVVSALPQWLNVRFDQLVMISLVAPHSLGLYAVAVAWSGAAQPLASVLASRVRCRRAAPGAGDVPLRRDRGDNRVCAAAGGDAAAAAIRLRSGLPRGDSGGARPRRRGSDCRDQCGRR
jgi:O-antigen/teichoic acid export membrane protein